MSTRVEKGGVKFKPILKAKTRPSATPAPHDMRTRVSAEPGASMPPPTSIPARTPSVAPMPRFSSTPVESSSTPVMQPGLSAPSRVTLDQPPRSNARSQPSRSRGSDAAISVIVTRPSQLPKPQLHSTATVQSTEGSGAVPDASHPDRSSLSSPTVIGEPSRGVPISTSRPLPLPSIPISPALANGKKRAAPEATDIDGASQGLPEPHPNANPSEERGSVAQKRPKLSILQAEEDRVRRRPIRRLKSKSAPAETEIEDGDTGQATSEAEGQKKRSNKKKKAVDENAVEGSGADGSPMEKHKRRKKQGKDVETSDAGKTNDSPSTSAVPPRQRRRRAATVEAAEPEGTPEPIDPTQIRMSMICDDPGSGRISSRWESSQIQYADARKRAREERARALAQADEEERVTGRIGAKKAAPKPVLSGDGDSAHPAGGGEESVVENTGQNPDEFTYTESLKASHYAPQVRIGANGEIVLDMDSLQVDRAADPELAEEPYSHVEESDQSKFTNNGSWSKRRVVRWGKEDTALFYDALRQFGQNFDLIARVLPGRTYRMCKNKFKAEDKKHPALIDEALQNSVAVDLDALSRMTGKDFTGPIPVIEAKKALNLGEDASRPANGYLQNESRSSGAGDVSVTENVGNVSSEQTIRQSTPPSPSILLSSTVATRRSTSPPSPESLLRTTGGGTSSGPPQGEGAVLPRPIPIAAPVRMPTTNSTRLLQPQP